MCCPFPLLPVLYCMFLPLLKKKRHGKSLCSGAIHRNKIKGAWEYLRPVMGLTGGLLALEFQPATRRYAPCISLDLDTTLACNLMCPVGQGTFLGDKSQHGRNPFHNILVEVLYPILFSQKIPNDFGGLPRQLPAMVLLSRSKTGSRREVGEEGWMSWRWGAGMRGLGKNGK